jgi:hypothetical protein
MYNINKYIFVLTAILFSFNSTIALANNYRPSYRYSSPQSPPPQPYIAENGSYRGQYSERTHRLKNDYVRGYQRQDGSYARGHYRSRRR